MNQSTIPATQVTPSRLPTMQAGAPVRAIVPSDFEGAWRIAIAITRSNMAPKDVKGPEDAMVIIMHGLEVGLPPMMALQSIANINGRPAIFGDGALGLIRGSGRLEYIREYFRGEPGQDSYTAVCEVKRRDEPAPMVGEFSIGDAKRARLWMKKGSNGQDTPWVTYWQRMLKMRARSWACRDGFADVLKGLAFAEEVQDIPPMRDVTPTSQQQMPQRGSGPPADMVDEEPPEGPAEGLAPATADDLTIPESLRRAAQARAAERAAQERPANAPTKVTGEPPPEEGGWDEAQWLRDLEGALGGCEDAMQIAEVQAGVMAPEKGQATPQGWQAAQLLIRGALDRIGRQ